jgi:TfoX/Sxy family transcriptional regulator of competence genes
VVFCDGVMFAMVTENALYVRVDEENRASREATLSAISGLMHCGILAVDEYARASCNDTFFVIDDLYSREC